MTILAIAMAALLPLSCRLPWQPANNTNVGPVAQYIAGYSTLTTGSVTREPRKQTMLYRELEKATGIGASDAVAYLAAIRNDPVAGKRLYDTIQSVITPPRDTTVNHK
jgi:hypothetical protein